MGLQLNQLPYYSGIADALSLIFAQLTAFIAHLAQVIGQQETQHAEASLRIAIKAAAAAAAAARSNARQPSQHAISSNMPQKVTSAAAATATRMQPDRTSSSPFAAVAAAGGAGDCGDAASLGLSALLSGMERQGSMVSSYLWEKKTGWATAREMLKREMDASLGHYVSAA